MWPYALLLLIPAHLAWNQRRPGWSEKPWAGWPGTWIAMFVLLVVMIGLRHEVGGDWFNYGGHLEAAHSMSFKEALSAGDPAYSALNWLGARTGMGAYFVNTVCGLIFGFGLVVFCRHLPLPWVGLVVAVPYLVMVVAMGYSRQGVAIGLAMLGFVALDKGRVMWFVIWVALAATFHKSAVILVPLAIFHRTRRPWMAWSVVIGSSIVLYLGMLQDSVETLRSNYVDAEMQSAGAAIRVAMNAVPAALFLIWRKRFALTAVQRTFWSWMSLAGLGFVVLLVISSSSTAVDRVALYWIPLQLFVLAHLPVALGRGGMASRRWVHRIVLYSAAVQFVWLFFAAHAYAWVPYKFYPWVVLFG